MPVKVANKKIKILTSAPIYAKGGVYGPVLTPYVEDVGTIYRMISSGIKVVEVFSTGYELELTNNNFDKENEPDLNTHALVRLPSREVTTIPDEEIIPDEVEPV